MSLKLLFVALLVLGLPGSAPSRDPKPVTAPECRWAAFGNNYCQIET